MKEAYYIRRCTWVQVQVQVQPNMWVQPSMWVCYTLACHIELGYMQARRRDHNSLENNLLDYPKRTALYLPDWVGCSTANHNHNRSIPGQ
jgi:hypothetical protein